MGAVLGRAETEELKECCRAASGGSEPSSCTEAVSHPGSTIVCVLCVVFACEPGMSCEPEKGVTPHWEETRPTLVLYCAGAGAGSGLSIRMPE